ncbi:MAG: RND transporter [Pararhodobacter sp.]|nr:RND transporter [Pararhodobacter sp.]
MTRALALLDRLPLSIALILGLGLGLSPFVPEPHLWEKLKMLAAGTLSRPIDILDLFYHAIPMTLLLAKLARMAWVARVR